MNHESPMPPEVSREKDPHAESLQEGVPTVTRSEVRKMIQDIQRGREDLVFVMSEAQMEALLQAYQEAFDTGRVMDRDDAKRDFITEQLKLFKPF